MSVAVFSRDAVLSRMLLLEAKRCGLQESDPVQARVWLIDLDHPARPEDVKNSTRSGVYAVLELPFSARELGAILHRRERAPVGALLREGETFWLAGKKLSFSKAEQKVLQLLVENPTRVVSAQEIEAILGDQAVKSNAVAVYLYRLRRKLEQDGVTRIRTVRGAGYRWIGE